VRAGRTPGVGLLFLAVGVGVRVVSHSTRAARLVAASFAALPRHAGEPELCYRIEAHGARGFLIHRAGVSLAATDDGDLLYRLEGDLVVALQRRRRELFFVHAAALAWRGRACMLAAPSGAGKSTLAWALVRHGHRYLSDELCPIDLASGCIEPYPHALCLKSLPPAATPPLPPATVRTTRTLHVPIQIHAATAPVPLAAIFFVAYRPQRPGPSLRPLSRAEAGARLYANTLNALAHPAMGLDAAIDIAARCRCYALESADLAATVALLRSVLERDGASGG
jgi:hypothetical protein